VDREKDIRVVNPKRITSDPVAFAFLMDFQYGAGDTQADGEKFVWNLHERGISLDDLARSQPGFKKFDLFSRRRQGEEERPLLLYVNGSKMSMLIANLLSQLGAEFDTKYVEAISVQLGDKRVPFPILSDREKGIAHALPHEIHNYARRLAFKKEGIEDSLRGNGVVEEGVGKKGDAITYNIDPNGKDRKLLPSAIRDELDAYDFNDFYKVVGFDFGDFDKLLKKRGAFGELAKPESLLCLFFDEVETLKMKDRLVVREERSMYGVEYDVFIVSGRRLYRLWAVLDD
jgi:hypothetical protein